MRYTLIITFVVLCGCNAISDFPNSPEAPIQAGDTGADALLSDAGTDVDDTGTDVGAEDTGTEDMQVVEDAGEDAAAPPDVVAASVYDETVGLEGEPRNFGQGIPLDGTNPYSELSLASDLGQDAFLYAMTNGDEGVAYRFQFLEAPPDSPRDNEQELSVVDVDPFDSENGMIDVAVGGQPGQMSVVFATRKCESYGNALGLIAAFPVPEVIAGPGTTNKLVDDSCTNAQNYRSPAVSGGSAQFPADPPLIPNATWVAQGQMVVGFDMLGNELFNVSSPGASDPVIYSADGPHGIVSNDAFQFIDRSSGAVTDVSIEPFTQLEFEKTDFAYAGQDANLVDSYLFAYVFSMGIQVSKLVLGSPGPTTEELEAIDVLGTQFVRTATFPGALVVASGGGEQWRLDVCRSPEWACTQYVSASISEEITGLDVAVIQQGASVTVGVLLTYNAQDRQYYSFEWFNVPAAD